METILESESLGSSHAVDDHGTSISDESESVAKQASKCIENKNDAVYRL